MTKIRNGYHAKYANQIMKNRYGLSVAILQRRLGIGYIQASRIIEEMATKECKKKKAIIPCGNIRGSRYKKEEIPIKKDTLLNTENLLFYVYSHSNFPLSPFQRTLDIVSTLISDGENIDLKLNTVDTMDEDKVRYILVWDEKL